jgi:hypothetical protein
MPVVTAPAAGTVHFAGFVVDRPVLSILHPGGVISSFEPVTTTLAIGDAVRAGQEIGTLEMGHCSRPCLHLGVRIDGGYVSPLLFLGGVPRAVLLPTRFPKESGLQLSPRMRQPVTLLKPLVGDVSVDLGGAEARVAEQLLHSAEVCSAIQKMGRGSVPQGVGAARAAAGDIRQQAGD